MHLDLTDGKKTAFVVLLKRAIAVAVVLLTAAPVNAEGPTDKTALEMAIATATRTPPHRCFVPIIKATDEALLLGPGNHKSCRHESLRHRYRLHRKSRNSARVPQLAPHRG